MTALVTDAPLLAACLCWLLTGVMAHYHPSQTQIADWEELLDDVRRLQYHPRESDLPLESLPPDQFSPLEGQMSPLQLKDILRAMDEEEDTSERKTASKRALSILTRWRSLGGVGRRTNALNKTPRAPMSMMQGEADGGAKDMPGRRVGGPLRWGRRR